MSVSVNTNTKLRSDGMNTIRTTSLSKSRIDRSHLRKSIAHRGIGLCVVILLLIFGGRESFAQGVGISESSITPNASAILELSSLTRGFLMPRNAATLGFTIQGLTFYNTTSDRINYFASGWKEIPVKTDNLSVFGSTTSAQLAGVISDETGTGLAVFATAPAFTGLSSTGAVVNLNLSSNFATNINTGTSTGAVSIGNSLSTGITLDPGTAGTTVIGDAAGTGAITLGSSTTTQTTIIGGGAGVSTVQIAGGAAANVTTIGDVQTAGSISMGNAMTSGTVSIAGGSAVMTGAITIGSTGATTSSTTIRGGTGVGAITLTPGIAGTTVIGAAAGTGAITLGSSSATQTVNVGTGAGAATVNIATGATNAKAVNIGAGAVANTILIGNTTAGTVTGINVAAATAQLHLGAGTATASQGAPLKLTTGTNLTAAEAGAVEYDGKVFYNTAVASTRQVTTTQQFISNTADFTMANLATAQSVFAAANDVITVAASTSYFFEATYNITGMGATTRTTATLFGGTATFTSIAYFATIVTGAANALSLVQSTKNCVTAAANVLNVTAVTAAATITLKGIMRINAAGTIIPQIQFSANPTGTILGTTNSWFRMWPIGTDAVAAVGNVN